MANFNLIGQNLRGKTVTFTFKDMDPFPENVTGNTHTVLSVLDSNTDDGISVKASRVEGNSYGYYDDVQIDTDSWPSVDSYQLSPITYEFNDNYDFIVTAYDANYVSCDLTEEDFYTTIRGKWKITNTQGCEIITSITEQVNFTSNNNDYTHIYLVSRGYLIIEYQKIVGEDEYENITGIAGLDPDTAFLYFNEDYAVIDFGTTPQKVSQHFVRCLNMIAEEMKTVAISGKWKIFDSDTIADTTFPVVNLTENINFTSNLINYKGINILQNGYFTLNYIKQDGTSVKVLDYPSGYYDDKYIVLDFGSAPQFVTEEFLVYLELFARPFATISGTWIFKGESYCHSTNFDDFIESVSFTANGYNFTGIAFYDVASEVMVSYAKADGTRLKVMWYVGEGEPEAALTEYYTVDFGTKPQQVSPEFMTFMTAMATPVTISGVWKISDTLGDAPAANTAQNVNFTVNGYNGIKLEFQSLAGTSNYSHLVRYYRSDGTSWTLTSPDDTVVTSNIVDFGEDPQYVSENFLLWMNHMAEPWDKVSGMWILNDGVLDFSMMPSSGTMVDGALQLLKEDVKFIDDSGNVSNAYVSFSIEEPASNTRALRYTKVTGSSSVVHYTNSSTGSYNWAVPNGRYLQFRETQYVSKTFKDFLEANAINIGEGSLEPGDYCFKLNIYNELSLIEGKNIYIPFTAVVQGEKQSYEQIVSDTFNDGTKNFFYMGTSSAYVYSNEQSAFPEFGWWHSGSCSSRNITITEKTYLTYSAYLFLSRCLIQLSSKKFLNTIGIQAMAQDMKTITDLTAKYAKYSLYTPVADVLYHNESGSTTVTGLNLSKYLYVTVRARASSRFIAPFSTAFAVKNIEDCGGSMELQIANPYNYCVWTVTNTSFTPTDYGSGSGYLIYEIIGYRYAAALTSLPEEDTPTYAYQWVRGQLSCASGKYFNNYYNSDYNTEFRVELNFRVTSLGVELASNTASANNNWSLSVNSNGNIVYKQMYNGSTGTGTWTNWTITPNKWYSLSLYSNNVTSTNNAKGQFNLSIVDYTESPVHTGNYVTKSMYYMSQFSTTRSFYIGGDNVDLRNRILVKGTKYHSGVTNTQSILDVDVDNAVMGGTLSLTSNSFTLTGGLVHGTEE